MEGNQPGASQKQDIERGQDHFYVLSLLAYEKCRKAERRGLYKSAQLVNLYKSI